MTTLADIKVIDVDTHVVEPHDLWTSRVSTAKWGDKVPHVIWHEGLGEQMWVSGDELLGPGVPVCAGWNEHPPKHPTHWDLIEPTSWNNTDRLKLMDEYGIYAQILYPNVAGFGAGRFSSLDPQLALLLLQAYNDFLTDWSSADPKRFIPVMAVPFWDIDLSIAEMTRCAAMGHRGMVFSQAPEFFGQPKLSDPHWDRLWAAAEEMQLTVNFHIGSGDLSGMEMLHPTAGVHANYASFPVTFFMGNARTIATLIGSGICHRFPKLNFVSVESGVGWLPFLCEGLDWMWKECGVAKEHPEYELLPSEYFKRQIYGCFWFEHGASLSAAIETIGADNILYETDFPHPTSMSPGPVSTALVPKDFISEKLGHIALPHLNKILHDNAARIYRLD